MVYQYDREKKVHFMGRTLSSKVLEKALSTGQSGTLGSECWPNLLLANDLVKGLKPFLVPFSIN